MFTRGDPFVECDQTPSRHPSHPPDRDSSTDVKDLKNPRDQGTRGDCLCSGDP